MFPVLSKDPPVRTDVLLMLDILISCAQYVWMIQTFSCELLLLCLQGSCREWDVSLQFLSPGDLQTALLLAAWKNSAHLCFLHPLFPFSPSLGNILETFQGWRILQLRRTCDFCPARTGKTSVKKTTNEVGTTERMNTNEWILNTYMVSFILGTTRKAIKRILGGSGVWTCMISHNPQTVMAYMPSPFLPFSASFLWWGKAAVGIRSLLRGRSSRCLELSMS